MNIENVKIRAGSGSGLARVGGTLHVNVSSSTTVGNTEQDLHSYTLPANSLKTTGDRIVWEGYISFTANANVKLARVYWGGTNIFQFGPDSSVDAGIMFFRITFCKDGSNSQKILREVWAYDNGGVPYTDVALLTASSATDTSTIIMKCTGQGVSNGDVTQNTTAITYYPAP